MPGKGSRSKMQNPDLIKRVLEGRDKLPIGDQVNAGDQGKWYSQEEKVDPDKRYKNNGWEYGLINQD